MSATKLCRKCGLEKPLDHFYRLRKGKDGRQSYCKDCTAPKKAGPVQAPSETFRPAPTARPGEWAGIYGGQVCEKCERRYWGAQCSNCLARVQHVFDTLRLLGGR